jgi:hypothetical protein
VNRQLRSAIGKAESKGGQSEAGRDGKKEGPSITKLLEGRRFWIDQEPPPLRPIYRLAGQVVGTPGNLATITAASKVGKTSVMAAMMASALGQPGRDYLGFESDNTGGLALLHFDSEQSPPDHWRLVDCALRRAGQDTQPWWLYSYCLTGLDYQTAWACVTKAARLAAQGRGGVHSILLDGVADLVCNVNDPAETNPFVAELHGMAIRYDCNIVCVIHFNPGSEKTRGHLGSQLERKAETNLRLDRDAEGVTVIWSDKQRRAPIPKERGPRFLWDKEARMHVSTATLAERRVEGERDGLKALVQEQFDDGRTYSYSDLKFTVMKAMTVKQRQAERQVRRMSELGLIERRGPHAYKIRTE